MQAVNSVERLSTIVFYGVLALFHSLLVDWLVDQIVVCMCHRTNIFENALVSKSTPHRNNTPTKRNSTHISFPIDSSACDIQRRKQFNRNYKIKPKKCILRQPK